MPVVAELPGSVSEAEWAGLVASIEPVPDFDVAVALSGTSVLSIPYAVNALEPLLAKAIRYV